MAYALRHKTALIRMGIPGASPGIGSVGGPMINPRSPGFRAGLRAGPLARQRLAAYGGFGGMGDPGLFGAIGKFARGAVRAVGKVAGGVARAAFNASPAGQIYNSLMPAFASRDGGASRNVVGPGVIPPAPGGFQLNMDSFGPPTDMETQVPVSTIGGGTAVVQCAPRGYHLNKSGYWRNESDLVPGASWIAPGTVLVKNRRLNPFNPRAASRAMRRLHSLAQGMKGLKREIGKVARAAGVMQKTSKRRAPARRAS